MTVPEFTRTVRLDTLGGAPRTMTIAADEQERRDLAHRFALPAIERLEATVTLTRDGETVTLDGRIVAAAVQACVASGRPVPATVDEPIALRFVPAIDDAEEVELDAGDLDTLPYEGAAVDIGEAVAQGLALALDPFPRAPDADAVLAQAGVLSEAEADAQRLADSPFAVLKRLQGEG